MLVVVLAALHRAFAAEMRAQLRKVAMMRRMTRHRAQRRLTNGGAVEARQSALDHVAFADVVTRAVLALVQALFERLNAAIHFRGFVFHFNHLLWLKRLCAHPQQQEKQEAAEKRRGERRCFGFFVSFG